MAYSEMQHFLRLPKIHNSTLLDVNCNRNNIYITLSYETYSQSITLYHGHYISDSLHINGQLTILGFMCFIEIAIKHKFDRFITKNAIL